MGAHDQWIRGTERGQAASANTVAHAPDFARHDRGPDDDNWMHAFGEQCAKCGELIEEEDLVRRRGNGGWVHQRCPARLTPTA